MEDVSDQRLPPHRGAVRASSDVVFSDVIHGSRDKQIPGIGGPGETPERAETIPDGGGVSVSITGTSTEPQGEVRPRLQVVRVFEFPFSCLEVVTTLFRVLSGGVPTLQTLSRLSPGLSGPALRVERVGNSEEWNVASRFDNDQRSLDTLTQ